MELPGVCASKSICFFCSKLNRRYRRLVFTDLSISDIYLHLHVGGVRSLRGLQQAEEWPPSAIPQLHQTASLHLCCPTTYVAPKQPGMTTIHVPSSSSMPHYGAGAPTYGAGAPTGYVVMRFPARSEITLSHVVGPPPLPERCVPDNLSHIDRKQLESLGTEYGL